MYTLRDCVWEITLACCFSCRHCGSSGGKARPDELTGKECLDLADQLADLGCERVALIGGEVFMRSDWDRIADRLVTKGVRTSIITNGFQMSETLVSRIREIGIESVAVSLDGMKEHHDRLRQPGSFARAEAAIDRLGRSGIPGRPPLSWGLPTTSDTLRRMNAACGATSAGRRYTGDAGRGSTPSASTASGTSRDAKRCMTTASSKET